MITIKIDGQEDVAYQFKDLQNGDVFACGSNVYVKADIGVSLNAVGIKVKGMTRILREMIVEPIELEWEDEDGENDLG